MKIYEIWIEGYGVTDAETRYGNPDDSKARKLATIEAENFDQAVLKAIEQSGIGWEYYRYSNGMHEHWLRRIYDNETDARKSYG